MRDTCRSDSRHINTLTVYNMPYSLSVPSSGMLERSTLGIGSVADTEDEGARSIGGVGLAE